MTVAVEQFKDALPIVQQHNKKKSYETCRSHTQRVTHLSQRIYDIILRRFTKDLIYTIIHPFLAKFSFEIHCRILWFEHQL